MHFVSNHLKNKNDAKLCAIYFVCKIPFCMQDTFARATPSAMRARDDRVSCIQDTIANAEYRSAEAKLAQR